MFGLINGDSSSPPTLLKQYGKVQDLLDSSVKNVDVEKGEICPIQFPYLAVKKVAQSWGLYNLDNLPQFFSGYYPLKSKEKIWVTTLAVETLLCLSSLSNYSGHQCVHIDKLPRNFEKLLNCNIAPLIVYGINFSNMEKAKDLLALLRGYPRPVILGVSSDAITFGLPMITEPCYIPVEKLIGAPLREYGNEKLREIVREVYGQWLSSVG